MIEIYAVEGRKCANCYHLKEINQDTNMNDGGYFTRYVCPRVGMRELDVEEVYADNDCVFFERPGDKLQL